MGSWATGTKNELAPRLVEALAGEEVVGAAADGDHTVVWTEAGELYTFGRGYVGMLGHGGQQHEFLPRLVKALAGKKVIGAATGHCHTAVWTEASELFTFGAAGNGKLGHGETKNERVPRLVEVLV